MKIFSPPELADLILKLNSKRTIHFYSGLFPRGDNRIGTSVVDDEVIHLSENGGGMRGTSFCSSKYYDEGVLVSERKIEDREKLICEISSNAGFHGSIVYLEKDDTRKEIGKVLSRYKRS